MFSSNGDRIYLRVLENVLLFPFVKRNENAPKFQRKLSLSNVSPLPCHALILSFQPANKRSYSVLLEIREEPDSQAQPWVLLAPGLGLIRQPLASHVISESQSTKRKD